MKRDVFRIIPMLMSFLFGWDRKDRQVGLIKINFGNGNYQGKTLSDFVTIDRISRINENQTSNIEKNQCPKNKAPTANTSIIHSVTDTSLYFPVKTFKIVQDKNPQMIP